MAGPTPAQLADLHASVHEEASARVWSQGVTLCRDDRVTGTASSSDEVTLAIRLPGRPVPFTVVLYPGVPLPTPWLYAALADTMAVGVGLAAGVLPARRAARLDPIESLRSE